ncbi:MAG: hypothetical protein ACYSR9_14740, partial [Planctomycetota bacterium]
FAFDLSALTMTTGIYLSANKYNIPNSKAVVYQNSPSSNTSTCHALTARPRCGDGEKERLK